MRATTSIHHKKSNLLIIPILLLITAGVISQPLFAATAAVNGNIEQGKILWQQSFTGKAPYTKRSCESCHGTNLNNTGQHLKTKKVIKAMALSATPTRYSNEKKVNKWFYRNCKWTLGRECSQQEQVNILAYLKSL